MKCPATGRGVIGRGVRFLNDPHNRVARVTAVRCVDGKHSYRLRDWEGRAVVYHYVVAAKPRPLPKKARFTYALMQAAVERVINPPVIAKRSPWVPASEVKFVRGDYRA